MLKKFSIVLCGVLFCCTSLPITISSPTSSPSGESGYANPSWMQTRLGDRVPKIIGAGSENALQREWSIDYVELWKRSVQELQEYTNRLINSLKQQRAAGKTSLRLPDAKRTKNFEDGIKNLQTWGSDAISLYGALIEAARFGATNRIQDITKQLETIQKKTKDFAKKFNASFWDYKESTKPIKAQFKNFYDALLVMLTKIIKDAKQSGQDSSAVLKLQVEKIEKALKAFTKQLVAIINLKKPAAGESEKLQKIQELWQKISSLCNQLAQDSLYRLNSDDQRIIKTTLDEIVTFGGLLLNKITEIREYMRAGKPQVGDAWHQFGVNVGTMNTLISGACQSLSGISSDKNAQVLKSMVGALCNSTDQIGSAVVANL